MKLEKFELGLRFGSILRKKIVCLFVCFCIIIKFEYDSISFKLRLIVVDNGGFINLE